MMEANFGNFVYNANMTNAKRERGERGKRDKSPQKAGRRATKVAPMEPMMDKAEYAEPSYAEMLQEAINMLPPDGYPRPVVLPPPVVAPVKRAPPRRAKDMADYGWDAQSSLSEPERDMDYGSKVLRTTAAPKPR